MNKVFRKRVFQIFVAVIGIFGILFFKNRITPSPLPIFDNNRFVPINATFDVSAASSGSWPKLPWKLWAVVSSAQYSWEYENLRFFFVSDLDSALSTKTFYLERDYLNQLPKKLGHERFEKSNDIKFIFIVSSADVAEGSFYMIDEIGPSFGEASATASISAEILQPDKTPSVELGLVKVDKLFDPTKIDIAKCQDNKKIINGKIADQRNLLLRGSTEHQFLLVRTQTMLEKFQNHELLKVAEQRGTYNTLLDHMGGVSFIDGQAVFSLPRTSRPIDGPFSEYYILDCSQETDRTRCLNSFGRNVYLGGPLPSKIKFYGLTQADFRAPRCDQDYFDFLIEDKKNK